MKKKTLKRRNPNNPQIKKYGRAVRKGEAIEAKMREFERYFKLMFSLVEKSSWKWKWNNGVFCVYQKTNEIKLNKDCAHCFDFKTALSEMWNRGAEENQLK